MIELSKNMSRDPRELHRGRVLVVEPQPPVAAIIAHNLQAYGFEVEVVGDGKAALEASDISRPDIILIDYAIENPRISDFCRISKGRPSTRDTAIFVCYDREHISKPAQTEKLRATADDLLLKPISIPNVAARLERVIQLKRGTVETGPISCGDITIDRVAHRVRRAGKPVHVSYLEFSLLFFLVQNPNRVFTREELLLSVWGTDTKILPRTVDTHIRYLRRALGQVDDIFPLRTVINAGYSLEESQP